MSGRFSSLAPLYAILLFLSPVLHAQMPTMESPAISEADRTIQICGKMSTIAIQALYERDAGRPARYFEQDGQKEAEVANAIIEKIYAEPAIRSPKRADIYARAYCNEQLWQARQ